jgi:hypothetical protein
VLVAVAVAVAVVVDVTVGVIVAVAVVVGVAVCVGVACGETGCVGSGVEVAVGGSVEVVVGGGGRNVGGGTSVGLTAAVGAAGGGVGGSPGALGEAKGLTCALISGVPNKPASKADGVGVPPRLVEPPPPSHKPSPIAPKAKITNNDPKIANDGCHKRISARAASLWGGCGASPAKIAMIDPANVM